MPFRDLGEGLVPDELAVLSWACDGACAELRLDRQEGNETQREYIAMLILKFVSHGLMDEVTLQRAAIAELRPARTAE